jgi:plastocyanin
MLKLPLRDRRLIALLAITALLVGFSAVSAFASSSSVKIHDDFFGVKTLNVSRGTKVTWNWVGVLRHNVTVKSGPSKFHSKTQARGSFSQTFTKKGTYHLFCTIHPFMTMTVIVH